MTVYELQKRLSNNIKRLRKGKFTQDELAEKTGLSFPTINGIEGCRRGFSLDGLIKIAAALECDIHELFIPSPDESQEISDLYSTIKKQILQEVRDSLNNTMDSIK